MAQDANSTQSPSETLQQTSTQPEVGVRDLDQGGEDGVTTTPEEMINPVQDTPEPVNDSPSEDLRKQLDELKASNDNLKKGLYDKGREMKDLKDALINAVPESEQQMADTTAEDAELEAAAQLLRDKAGFLDNSALEAFEKRMEQKNEVNSILSANPQINKEVLSSLMETNKELHVYDVIEKYKGTLLGDQSLQKAHNRPLMGEPIAKEAPQATKITDMDSTQLKAFLDSKSTGQKQYI